MAYERRPIALPAQLKALWACVEALEEEVGEGVEEGGDGSAPSDPGDITVYFENSLVGP
jgi:hypothetical protein